MQTMHSEMASARSSGDSDIDFVRVMVPHHRAALDMAKTELLHGRDPEMRRLAQEIVADQQSEIELMNLWLKYRGGETDKRAKGRPSNRPAELNAHQVLTDDISVGLVQAAQPIPHNFRAGRGSIKDDRYFARRSFHNAPYNRHVPYNEHSIQG